MSSAQLTSSSSSSSQTAPTVTAPSLTTASATITAGSGSLQSFSSFGASTSAASATSSVVITVTPPTMKQYYLIFNPQEGNYYVAEQETKVPQGCERLKLEEQLVVNETFEKMIREQTPLPYNIKVGKAGMSRIGTGMTCFAMMPQGLLAALMAHRFSKSFLTENLIALATIDFLVFVTGVWGKQRIVNFYNDPAFTNFCAIVSDLIKDAKNPGEWTLGGCAWKATVTAQTIVFAAMFAGLTKAAMGMDVGIAKLLHEEFSAETLSSIFNNTYFQAPFIAASLVCNALGTRNILYYGGLATKDLLVDPILKCFSPEDSIHADKYYLEWFRILLKDTYQSQKSDSYQSYFNLLAQGLKESKLKVDAKSGAVRIDFPIFPGDFDAARVKKLFDRLASDQKAEQKSEQKKLDEIVALDRSCTRAAGTRVARIGLGTAVAWGFFNFYYWGSEGVSTLLSMEKLKTGTQAVVFGVLNFATMVLMGISSTVDIGKALFEVFAGDASKYAGRPDLLEWRERLWSKILACIVCAIGAFANAEQEYLAHDKEGHGSPWEIVGLTLAFLAPLIQELYAFYDISRRSFIQDKGPYVSLTDSIDQALVYQIEGAGSKVTADQKSQAAETKVSRVSAATASSATTPLLSPQKDDLWFYQRPLAELCGCRKKPSSEESPSREEEKKAEKTIGVVKAEEPSASEVLLRSDKREPVKSQSIWESFRSTMGCPTGNGRVDEATSAYQQLNK